MPGWKTGCPIESGATWSPTSRRSRRSSPIRVCIPRRSPSAARRARRRRRTESRAAFYDSIGCRKCHGDQRPGRRAVAPTLRTMPVIRSLPRTCTELALQRRGSVEDIYHRLRTGLDGTPMPSFSDLLEQKFLTDEQLWRIAQYVRSLSPDEPPVVRDVIHAPLLTRALPHAPDDSAWTAVDTYWFPLVGQIIRKQRCSRRRSRASGSKTVHTADSIALRVSWDDRSESPDSAWLPSWGGCSARSTATTRRGAARALAGPAGRPVFPFPFHGNGAALLPDGQSERPRLSWRWTSSARAAAVAGLARASSASMRRATVGWGCRPCTTRRVARRLYRALASPDTASQLPFRTGRAIQWLSSRGTGPMESTVGAWHQYMYILALGRTRSGPGVHTRRCSPWCSPLDRPREESHWDGTAGPERKLACRIRRSKCAGKDDAPLAVVVHGLHPHPTVARRIEALDAPRQPGNRGRARAAGPAPLIDGGARTAHQEVGPLHARGNGNGKLDAQLVRPERGLLRVESSLSSAPSTRPTREARRYRGFRAISHDTRSAIEFRRVHRFDPDARDRRREPALLANDLPDEREPVRVHRSPGRIVRGMRQRARQQRRMDHVSHDGRLIRRQAAHVLAMRTAARR